MINYLHKYFPLALLPFVLVVAHGRLQADPLTLKSSVSPNGANYLYDFAVTDTTSTDPYNILVSVTVSVPVGVGTIIGNVAAPAGNEADWDPGLGDVDFVSDNLNGFPVGTAVDGFQFTSPLNLTAFSFSGLYLDSTQSTATAFSGVTRPSAVPEPSTWGLFGAASAFLLGGYRRLRRLSANR